MVSERPFGFAGSFAGTMLGKAVWLVDPSGKHVGRLLGVFRQRCYAQSKKSCRDGVKLVLVLAFALESRRQAKNASVAVRHPPKIRLDLSATVLQAGLA